MSCCSNLKLTILTKGVQISENVVQNDNYTLLFFPYSSIETVRYDFFKEERSGTLSLFIKGGQAPYYFRFPCFEEGRRLYEELLTKLNSLI